jgi:hypothetical protein
MEMELRAVYAYAYSCPIFRIPGVREKVVLGTGQVARL